MWNLSGFLDQSCFDCNVPEVLLCCCEILKMVRLPRSRETITLFASLYTQTIMQYIASGESSLNSHFQQS